MVFVISGHESMSACLARFFQQNFDEYALDHGTGLLTGYMEAQLHCSWQPTARFNYPVYAWLLWIAAILLFLFATSIAMARMKSKTILKETALAKNSELQGT